jgi:hypothetical protein
MMKMSTEDFNTIVEAFEQNKEVILKHYEMVERSGNFHILEKRVAWDALRAFVSTKWICGQYDKGLHDGHITTACMKALEKIL